MSRSGGLVIAIIEAAPTMREGPADGARPVKASAEGTTTMTAMFPALAGALTGIGLYVAFDFYYLASRRRVPVESRRPRRG